jgi:hypothetical protein
MLTTSDDRLIYRTQEGRHEMTDYTHLAALETRLSHEKARLGAAKTARECAMRCVWVKRIEKEIADERAFLGLYETPFMEMSDDELLAELTR